MNRFPEKLELELASRLRQVVGGQPVSETELRLLADEAGGWTRVTEAQLGAAEERLARMNADPTSPLSELAAEVRRVEALSHELGEARRLVEGLERRTRELRTAWLKHCADSGSPLQPRT
ncbi:MAG: hypothetical protein ACJ75G_06345 [Gaiellaceae bacterium]